MSQVYTRGHSQLLRFTQFDSLSEHVSTGSFNPTQDATVECHHGSWTVSALLG